MTGRALFALVAGLALWFAAGVAPAANGNKASATAFAVVVKVAGGDGATAGYASAPPSASASGSGFVYPGDGSVVSVGSASASAKTGPGAAAHASAAASVGRVSLFGGEINIGVVSLAAKADAASSGASGDVSGSSVGGLAVDGNGIAVGANARVNLGDWGYAVALEQAVQKGDGPGPGERVFVTGFHVYLTAAHGGLPAGSEILVGYAEAAAEVAPLPPPATTSGTDSGSPSSGSGQAEGGGGGNQSGGNGRDPKPLPPGANSQQPAIVRNPPPNVQPDITGAGYVFPVYGRVSFSDDFGAPRADTVWHHGNDIFAALGTPVLAVADGTLFSVGWNHLGGQRLWLRDTQGNEYYYAHLSAYSPLAVDGAHVQAGDVVGFVGNTGDAAGTPYHLHFEIHPKALLGLGYDGVINPYPYLSAWYARRDESFQVTIPEQSGQAAPEPGAVVLDSNDISTVSGLDHEALERALALPALLEGIGAATPVVSPPLVGGPPGFAS